MENRSYQTIEGTKCFAPKLAYGNDGFDKNSFLKLYRNESHSFWFKARNKFIRYLVNEFLADGGVRTFLEIGCGTGYVLQGLSAFPWLHLTGSEIYLQGIRIAKQRTPGVDFIQMDARDIPFSKSFDAIGAFDVLEHIPEDVLVIKNVYDALKPGGKFFLSVPQHQFMWSDVDVISKHQRRYSRSDLLRKLTFAGFTIDFCSSFIFTLFPVMFISRFFKRKNATVSGEFNLPVPINNLFYFLTNLELLLIRVGLRLPFGGSIVCVAAKPI